MERQEYKPALAFRQEFYEGASQQQIVDDVVSYLGEYRFEVPEFSYRMGLSGGKLTDPNTGDAMTVKAEKAIGVRRSDGLITAREEAELEGLLSIESQLKDKQGTIVWFSPPGEEKDGYGRYGFAYTGKIGDGFVDMTAIRVEDPKISDFNDASSALWGEDYEEAEGFLRSPRIINVEEDSVKEFIHGNFEIKNKDGKEIFRKAIQRMRMQIDDFSKIAASGSEDQRHAAFHAIENMSLELRQRIEEEEEEGVLFINNFQMPDLLIAMTMDKYKTPAPAVKGSCGMSSNLRTNEIFRSILFGSDSKITGSSKREFGFDKPGPCRLCERDVPCGPCKICESCNDKIDAGESGD